ESASHRRAAGLGIYKFIVAKFIIHAQSPGWIFEAASDGIVAIRPQWNHSGIGTNAANATSRQCDGREGWIEEGFRRTGNPRPAMAIDAALVPGITQTRSNPQSIGDVIVSLCENRLRCRAEIGKVARGRSEIRRGARHPEWGQIDILESERFGA